MQGFRNGVFAVKHHFFMTRRRDTIVRSRGSASRHLGRVVPPGAIKGSCRPDGSRPACVPFGFPEPGFDEFSHLAVSFAGVLLPSVVSAAAANVMPGPKRSPSANLPSRTRTQHDGSATSVATCIIGNRVPARGHRWITHRQARLFPPLLVSCRWDAAAPILFEAPLPLRA